METKLEVRILAQPLPVSSLASPFPTLCCAVHPHGYSVVTHLYFPSSSLPTHSPNPSLI